MFWIQGDCIDMKSQAQIPWQGKDPVLYPNYVVADLHPLQNVYVEAPAPSWLECGSIWRWSL